MPTNRNRRKMKFTHCLTCDKKLPKKVIEQGMKLNHDHQSIPGSTFGCNHCRVSRPRSIICEECCRNCKKNYKGKYVEAVCDLHRPKKEKKKNE